LEQVVTTEFSPAEVSIVFEFECWMRRLNDVFALDFNSDSVFWNSKAPPLKKFIKDLCVLILGPPVGRIPAPGAALLRVSLECGPQDAGGDAWGRGPSQSIPTIL